MRSVYHIFCLAVLSLFLALPAASRVQSSVSRNLSSKLSKVISLHVDEAMLEQVLRSIAERGNIKLVYESYPILFEKRVTLSLEKVSVQEALREATQGTGLKSVFSSSGQLILVKRSRVAESPKMKVRGTSFRVKPGAVPTAQMAPFRSKRPKKQQGTITGTVTDSLSGEPIPGVNVVISGTQQGTSTDAEGQYTISSVEPGTYALQASFVGYGTKTEEGVEVQEGQTAQVDFQLVESAVALEEIVAVGYGTQRKSTVTGAISSLDFEEMTPLATQRTDQMLQGRAAGVMVRNVDAAPGGETRIRIRGFNSIQGGNDALIVVDGIQGGDLTSINPNDVENIEVLKGPSATAIYGSQGANGVVLITTKRGRTGAPRINYSSEVGASNLAREMDLLSAAEYARHVNLFELADNVGRDPKPLFSESEIEEFERTGGTDWQNVMYRTAVTHNHQLSVSGGTETVNYFVSGGYLNQQGILRNSGYNRLSLRTNLRADATHWLSAGLNWSGSRENDHSPKYGSDIDHPNNPVKGALEYPPTIPVLNEDGSYSTIPNEYGPTALWNPYASAEEPLIDNSDFRNNIRAFLDFTLLEGLSLEVSGAASIVDADNIEYWNMNTFHGNQQGGQGHTFDSKSNYYQFQNILNYETSFGEHTINATAVAEQKYSEYFSKSATNTQFLNHETGVYDMSGSEIQNNSTDHSERLIRSGLGRVNYDFADRYLLSASFRADGSSVFGKNNKWGYFPAGSVGWRLSEEALMQDVDLINNLMLRASAGRTGNQAISPFQTLAAVTQAGNYPWYGGEGITRGYVITRAANSLLRWETTTQANVGIDIGLFDGRLNITGEYYNKLTEDLLMAREISTYTGLSSIISNVGSMRNTGFELSLDAVGQIWDFEWDSGINVTRSTTIVEDLGPEIDELPFSTTAGGTGATENPLMWLEEGEEFGQMRGWGYEGTWNEDEAELAAEYGQLPGDPRYTDVNGDGQIDQNDRKVIGYAQPDFIFGLTNRFGYKNFDLDFLIQGVVGNDVFNYARITRTPLPSAEVLDRWTPENQDTDVPAIIDAQTREAANLTSTIFFSSTATERWVEDASYIRLKSVALGYSLPLSLTNRLQINNMRIYVSATNLLTITGYSGFDPEVSSDTGSDATLGTDYNNYPSARMYNIGINMSF